MYMINIIAISYTVYNNCEQIRIAFPKQKQGERIHTKVNPSSQNLAIVSTSQSKQHVIVVTWARGICLICMPEARRPEGIHIR